MTSWLPPGLGIPRTRALGADSSSRTSSASLLTPGPPVAAEERPGSLSVTGKDVGRFTMGTGTSTKPAPTLPA